MNRRSLLQFIPASIAVAFGGVAVASTVKAEATQPRALLITTEEGGNFRLPVAVGGWRHAPGYQLVHSIFFDNGSVWDATLAGWRYGPDAVRAADYAKWAEQLAHDQPPFNFTTSDGYGEVIA